MCAKKMMLQNVVGIIKVPDNKLEEFNTLLTDFYNTNNNETIKQFIFDNCIDGIVFQNLTKALINAKIYSILGVYLGT